MWVEVVEMVLVQVSPHLLSENEKVNDAVEFSKFLSMVDCHADRIFSSFVLSFLNQYLHRENVQTLVISCQFLSRVIEHENEIDG